MAQHLDFGKTGEDIAENFLKQKGFKMVTRNFRCKGGEIDLIATKKQELHFIEVKARRNTRFGDPIAAIDASKRRRLSKAAVYYMLKNPKWQNNPRVFSVLGIDLSRQPESIEFIENAFEIEGGYY